MIGRVFEDGLSSPDPKLRMWRVIRVSGSMAEAELVGMPEQKLGIPLVCLEQLLAGELEREEREAKVAEYRQGAGRVWKSNYQRAGGVR